MIGTLLGIGSGIAGLIGGEMSRSQRRKQIQQARERLAQRRQESLLRGYTEIQGQTNDAAADAGRGAAKRALAGGRRGSAEDYILPAQSNIRRQGNRALSSFTSATNNQYDSALNNLDTEEALQDPGANPMDYLGVGLGAASGIVQDDEFFDQMGLDQFENAELPDLSSLPSSTPSDLLTYGIEPMEETDWMGNYAQNQPRRRRRY